MYTGQTIFSQLLDFLPKKQFDRCVRKYHGNRRIKSFSCYDQFLSMSFAQITNRRSLRGIETSLRAMGPKLYHCGFRSNIYRTTLAKANENRHWRIYADFAHILINKAQSLYANDYLDFLTGREVYALDSTTIDLCLTQDIIMQCSVIFTVELMLRGFSHHITGGNENLCFVEPNQKKNLTLTSVDDTITLLWRTLIMSKRLIVFLLFTVLLFGSGASGAIISFDCEPWSSSTVHAWNFDYELQQLTLTDIVYELDWYGLSLEGGTSSAGSVFSIHRTLTNNTQVPWTSHMIQITNPFVLGGGEIIVGSAQSTKLQTIAYPEYNTIQFSGFEPVLNGESFTVQFDIVVGDRGFGFSLRNYFIPEPASFLLLSIGALALTRNRKNRRVL